MQQERQKSGRSQQAKNMKEIDTAIQVLNKLKKCDSRILLINVRRTFKFVQQKEIIPKINVLKRKVRMQTKNTSTSKVDDVEKCSSSDEHLFVGSLY